MARKICLSMMNSFRKSMEVQLLMSCGRSDSSSAFLYGAFRGCAKERCWQLMQGCTYSRGRANYNLFDKEKVSNKDSTKAWRDNDQETSLWTESDEDESDLDHPHSKAAKRLEKEAEERGRLIDADDSDELRSVWSGSDDEKTLWTGSEDDDDEDIPSEPYPNERSDAHIDKLFEYEEISKYRSMSQLLNDEDEDEPPELSPGKQARKIAVQNALKKLKKGPDGRYTNVWEVVSDIDILIGAFENIVSGPEYAELRENGPKKLDMQFFKDIQARMRDPNFKFTPEIKLKPKNKLVSKKKWQRAQARRRKDERR